jgi:hypothetical protein
MSAIVFVILAVIAVVPFIAIVTATMLVTGAVRTEERRMTLRYPAPGPCTQLVRSLLAVPYRYLSWPDREQEDIPAQEREPAWARAGTGS